MAVTATMHGDVERVTLRAVREDDLATFYEQQQDPHAAQLAAVPSRQQDDFLRHWRRVLADPTNVTRTIVADGSVAGNVVSYLIDAERHVGYWLGREFWGRGIATQALSVFLADAVRERPLYATVAVPNLPSRRVLEKCGFVVCGAQEDVLLLALRG